MHFIVAVLLLGAVTTIAVAWGCRWVTDERRIDADSMVEQRPEIICDAHPSWGDVFSSENELDAGGDGRRFLSNRIPPRTWERWYAAYGAERYSVDVGVDWIVVLAPGYETVLWTEYGWAADRVRLPSEDSAQWRSVDRDIVPWWSDVESESLAHDAAVIEMAAGWPMPALVVTHHLPWRTIAWDPMQRDTTGAFYGHPFDRASAFPLMYRPQPIGFALDALVYALAWSMLLMLGIAAPHRLRVVIRRRRQRCVGCAHQLVRDGGACCPECGADGLRAALPWRAGTAAATAALVLLVVAEVFFALEVRANPVSTPIVEAAYHGDVERLRRLLDDAAVDANAGTLGDVRWAFIGGGAFGGGIADGGPYAAVLIAAMFGEQLESVRTIFEHAGAIPDDTGSGMSESAHDLLLFAAPFGRAEFLTRVFDEFGWTVHRVGGTGRYRRERIEPVLMTGWHSMDWPIGWRDVVVERLQSDPEWYRIAWEGAVCSIIWTSDLESIASLIRMGPPAGFSITERENVIGEIDLFLDQILDQAPIDPWYTGVNVTVIRRALLRALRHRMQPQE